MRYTDHAVTKTRHVTDEVYKLDLYPETVQCYTKSTLTGSVFCSVLAKY